MTRWGALALLIGSLAIHWPIDRADFSYDDRDFVQTNALVTSLPGALRGFAEPFPPDQPGRALYRPLTGLSYALDHARAGFDGHAFHATNAVLYALLVVAVQRLGLALGLGAAPALAFAALFAAHPVHCDAVDSVSGRSEVLSLLLGVGSLLCFLRIARRPAVGAFGGAGLASAGLYLLACLAKETGVMLLGGLVAARLALGPPGDRGAWRASLRPLAPHALVLLGYLVLRVCVLGRFSPEAAVLADADLTTRLATMGSVFALSLESLLWPRLELDFYYQAAVGIVPSFTPLAWVGWAAAACGLAAAAPATLRALRGQPLGESEALGLCGGALLVAPLLPTSHAFDIGALFAERFLFAPSLGFLLLVVLAGRGLLGRLLPGPAVRPAGFAICVALVLAGAVASQARALEWRDAARLWESAGRHVVDKRVHTNLAAAYIERGQPGLARTQLEAALAIAPDYAPALGNLGVLQLEAGQIAAARESFRRLARRDPGDARTWYNLGRVERAAGNHQAAARHFERAVALAPSFHQASEALAALRAQQPSRR